MIKIVVIILLLFMPSTSLCDEWNTEDTAWEVVAVSSIAIDYLQTREIAKQPERFRETNVYLGEHPSTNSVDAYFAICVVGHAAVSYFLPSSCKLFGIQTNPRRLWQMVWIGIETNAAVNNYRIGIRF